MVLFEIAIILLLLSSIINYFIIASDLLIKFGKVAIIYPDV